MKGTTQVRIDKFESRGSHCRIIGRKDHIINTEQYIKRSFIIRAKVRAEVVSRFTFDEDEKAWQPFGERMGHVPFEYGPEPDWKALVSARHRWPDSFSRMCTKLCAETPEKEVSESF